MVVAKAEPLHTELFYFYTRNYGESCGNFYPEIGWGIVQNLSDFYPILGHTPNKDIRWDFLGFYRRGHVPSATSTVLRWAQVYGSRSRRSAGGNLAPHDSPMSKPVWLTCDMFQGPIV